MSATVGVRSSLPHAVESAELEAVDRVRVRWCDGREALLWTYWLRILATDEMRFDGVASAWTDGANFHPQATFSNSSQQVADLAVASDGASLRVEWGDAFTHSFEAGELYRLVMEDDPVRSVPVVTWDASFTFRHWSWNDVMRDDAALREFLHTFLSHGVVFVCDVPSSEQAILEFGERVGGVAPSHLGDLFTVKVTDSPQHIGEVSDAIPLHIDLVYRQNTPEIQVLHALRQIEGGGENEFVDGRLVLEVLSPPDREMLTRTPVEFVAESTAVHFRGQHPVLRVDERGEFEGIYYNQYKIRFPHWVPPDYFAAFERFRMLIHSRPLVNAFLLPQDHLVMFDNRRVLHGRRSFADHRRQAVGCFLRGDDVRSLYRLLAR